MKLKILLSIPTCSAFIQHNNHRRSLTTVSSSSSINTRLNVDVNDLVQLSVLFGAGATVFYLGDGSSSSIPMLNAFNLGGVDKLKSSTEEEDKVDLVEVIAEDMVEEDALSLNALDEESSAAAAAADLTVISEAVTDSNDLENIEEDEEEKEARIAVAIEAEREADMKRARQFAANNSMKEEEKRVAKIEGQRKADMDAARKLAAERAKFSATAETTKLPVSSTNEESPTVSIDEKSAVETSSTDQKKSIGFIRKRALPLVVASLFVATVMKVAKMYVGRGLL